MQSKTTAAIGFIGLGRMGAPMAMRLIDAGHSLVVCDIDATMTEKFRAVGAEVVSDIVTLAESVQITLLCLPTPQVVRDVVLGEHGLIEGSMIRTVVDLSTTGPAMTKHIANELKLVGKSFIDSPVTGGIRRAISGELTMMLGASAHHASTLIPVLSCMSNRIVRAGSEPGSGQMLKVLNNFLSFVALGATSEAMALGVKAGLEPKVMLEVFNTGSGRNSATEEKFPHSVLSRSFNFGFPVNGVLKDLGLCLEAAQELDVEMPIGNTIQQLWKTAAVDHGEEDMTAIAKIFERWAGIEIRG